MVPHRVAAVGERNLVRGHLGVVMEAVEDLKNTGSFWYHNWEVRMRRRKMEELISQYGLCSEMSAIRNFEKACAKYGIVLEVMHAHQRAILYQQNDQDMQFWALIQKQVSNLKARQYVNAEHIDIIHNKLEEVHDSLSDELQLTSNMMREIKENIIIDLYGNHMEQNPWRWQ